MSTFLASQARMAVASAMQQPDVSRRMREARQLMFSPAAREVQEILDSFVQPMRETLGGMHAHEALVGAVSPLRRAFDQAIEARDQIGDWLARINPFQQPAKVFGLEEQLVGFRRRSIDAASAAHVQLRALLASRSQQGPPPGRFVTTQPQVTRGPNTRRSITPNQPAGLVRV